MRLERVIEATEGPFRLEAGRLARQADGSVLVTFGDTKVLATATRGEVEELDYFPLVVDYEEKFYAGGKIPGGFFKREGKPSDEAVLHARLIDRPIRPLFPCGYWNRVHVVATVLSADKDRPPEVVGILGASTALLLSSVPFTTPVAGVRVGRANGRLIANPTAAEREASDLDIVVAGTATAVTMVEGTMKELPEGEVIAALEFAHSYIRELCAFQERFVSQAQVEKVEVATPEIMELKERLSRAIGDRFRELRAAPNKLAREELLRTIKEEALAEVRAELEGTGAAEDPQLERNLSEAFEELFREFIRRTTVETGVRIDNRRPEEIRPISIEVGILPRVHGSALFTRGETQSLGTCTLGTTRQDEQIIDRMLEEGRKRFMLHYNFPPYSVGEAGRMGPPSRREIGHGHLAENALQAILPSEEEFPYIIRVVSEVLESNGSSSMATVCSSSLAMMDAGVPLKGAVAGIALGLIEEGPKRLILSDIVGMEDHYGDMDFKVAGTRRGVTAFQLDVKSGGLTRELLEEALARAHKARMKILDEMEAVLPAPRPRLSPYAPVLEVIHVNPDKLGLIIGPGGRTIRGIIDRTETEIDIEDDGTVRISGPNRQAVAEAIATIEELTEELEVGKRYRGKVTRIERYGAFVKLPSGVRGLIHVSDLANGYVKNVEDIVKLGDEVTVEVIAINELGRPDFRRVPEEGEEARPVPQRREAQRPRRGGRRNEQAAAPAAPPRKKELQAGDVLTGTVKNLAEFGAFVELDDGAGVGLIHISELSDEYVKRVEDVVRPGERVAVKVLKIDNRGRIYLKRLARADIKVS
ncbi:MAG: polyribonucleotide nucleotidyltransferase [Candidatus Acetothermia bacterium]|jgi:polyribonucleotide nucleotidyltransferase|nr:polyribonucleotide nucleotidyltransferase [Candidatus Acetothermia bacterium]MDH7504743.1 polyribonucleotide nucleotidyltransferase [Candidatus Acetothermia bacterium]